MLHSKTFTLCLLGLTWSIGSLPVDAARVRSSNIRGRWLQDNTEEIPSADKDPEKEEKAPKTLKGITARSIGPDARECITKQDKDNVEFECKSVTTDGSSQVKDTLRFKVGATKGDHLKITVDYATKWESTPSAESLPSNEAESSAITEAPQASNKTEGPMGRALQAENATESENRTKYTLVYDRLIEYRKNGTASDGHYEWGVDEIVAEYPLDKWDSLTPVQNNSDLLTFSATVGMATFNFTISQSDATSISTNKMKIDFLLEDYPWADTNDTYIALISHIETERRTRTGRAGPGSDRVADVVVDFDASQTNGYVPFGEYTWASTAEATTVSTDAVGDFDENVVNGTGVEVERTATYNSTDEFGNFTGDGNFTSDETSGNFSSAGTSGNFTTSPRTATISVVASSSNRTDPGPREGPGHHPGDGTFQEIAFSFVGAGKGAQRIFWDPEAGVGYSSSPARMVGSLVLLASSAVLALLL